MWQRMSESEGGGKGMNVDFMSTHPANAKRIQVSQIRLHPRGKGYELIYD
jgi:predicted Zn-dependent protease